MKQFIRINLILAGFLQIACVSWGQVNSSDCGSAQILCDKRPIVINELSGHGNLPETSLGTCFSKDFEETNSAWFKWKVADAGIFTFTILPLNEEDDVDFALYRIKNLAQCNFYEPVRCLASGPYLGNESGFSQGCTGATGLRTDAGGVSQSSGCAKGGNNFLSPIEMEASEYYALFINNFRSTGGVLIEWSGTVTFQSIPGHCTSASDMSSSRMLQNGNQIQFSDPFPNPASDRVNITSVSNKDIEGQLQVIGSDGQLEFFMPFALSSGNNLIEVPIKGLRSGVHFVKLRTNAETHLLRFVKH